MQRWKFVVGLLLATAFAISGCGQSSNEQPSNSQTIASHKSEAAEEKSSDHVESEPKDEKTKPSGNDDTQDKTEKQKQPDQAEKKNDPAPNKKTTNDSQEQKKAPDENSGETKKQESKASEQKENKSDKTSKPDSPPKEEAKSTPSKPAEENKKTETKPQAPKKEIDQAQIMIQGDNDMGSILGATNVDLKNGDTVYDVLFKITKEKHIQLETSGSGAGLYVKGINNLYEFDRGDLSGWVFKVNGKKATKSAGEFAVKKGDRIEWLYSENMGKDV